jgi:hypothetical protein
MCVGCHLDAILLCETLGLTDLCWAVLRGAALSWALFSVLAWRLYMLVLLLDYAYCMVSTTVSRQVKNIPRRELVKDIAGICIGIIGQAIQYSFKFHGKKIESHADVAMVGPTDLAILIKVL